MHQRRIDGFVVVTDATAEDGRAVVVVVDDVTVATGGGAEAGMEMLVHLPDPAHGDVGGRLELSPRVQAPSARFDSVSKWITWPVACTPASVRPAHWMETGWLAMRLGLFPAPPER